MNQFVDEDSENEEYISGDEEEDEELNVDRKIIKKSMFLKNPQNDKKYRSNSFILMRRLGRIVVGR